MPLFVAVVPPEWHMWGYNPKKFSARFARRIFIPPTLKIVAPPLILIRLIRLKSWNSIMPAETNFVSYISAKYYLNLFSFRIVIMKVTRVNFFWNTVHMKYMNMTSYVYLWMWMWLNICRKMSKISTLSLSDVFFQALNTPKLVFGLCSLPRPVLLRIIWRYVPHLWSMR